MPYKDPEQRKAVKRASARKRRASPLTQFKEREANRRRMAAGREQARPVPQTPAEMLKDAERFGPAEDGQLDNVITGVMDEYRTGIGTLAETAISGRGFDYNPERTFGEPYWWHPDFNMPDWWHEDGIPLRGESLRWARFCLRFRDQNWSKEQGRAAEAKGAEIAAVLRTEPADVRKLAECLRDGRPTDWLTPPAETAARARLEDLRLMDWPTSTWRARGPFWFPTDPRGH